MSIKYNQNTKVEIDPFLLRVLYWNIIVDYLSQEYTHPKNHVRVMQCFTLFCLMVANKMISPIILTQQIFDSTVKIKKIIDVIVKYNMGK